MKVQAIVLLCASFWVGACGGAEPFEGESSSRNHGDDAATKESVGGAEGTAPADISRSAGRAGQLARGAAGEARSVQGPACAVVAAELSIADSECSTARDDPTDKVELNGRCPPAEEINQWLIVPNTCEDERVVEGAHPDFVRSCVECIVQEAEALGISAFEMFGISPDFVVHASISQATALASRDDVALVILDTPIAFGY